MSDVLGVAWRTVAFGWRFGSALVTAAIAGVVGVLVGFVGFVVPVGFTSLSGRVVHQGVGEGGSVFHQVGRAGIEGGGGIVGGGGLPGCAKGIEDCRRASGRPCCTP